MKNKKGFTLVELLAVVIILGIIALISVPVTQNVLKTVRKNIFLDNVNQLLKLVKTNQLQTGGNITYSIENDNINPKLNYKKEFKGTGMIMIDEDGNTTVSIELNNFCAYKTKDETAVEVYEDSCNNVKEKKS